MDVLTLLDIAKMNGSDAVVGLVEEATQQHPEITGSHMGRALPGVGAMRTIRGINYKTLVRTALPTVGFRDANEGSTKTRSQYVNKQFETYIMNPRWELDKAVGDSHEDGWQAVMAMEGAGHLEAAFQTVRKAFYYGTNATFGAAKAFPGLLQMYDAGVLEVDAAGTTDSVASSLWAVRFGPMDVQWILGMDGSLDLSDVRIESVLDANSLPFTAYVQEILSRIGLQSTNKRSVGRIKKLTTDSGKGLTDDLVFSLLEKMSDYPPDVFFCSYRSLEQLRASRTATTTTGAPAPIPTEVSGIPLIPTKAILDTETLAL